MKRYNPPEIEPVIQNKWSKGQLYAAKDFDVKPKFVMLTEFPYPSGDGLHMGHVREYTLGDIIARRKRMGGYNVLYPMGYDAFGLPTENYAIKNKIAPQLATEQNITNFQKQFESLGFSIDWSRKINTTDPSYYKWTQWLFLQFVKAGLAYQKEIDINWCPKCKTGLANEEVVGGLHERCDTPVEKRRLKQWLLKITDYADKLIDGLDTVDYPSKIADQQINWIGRSVGAEVDFIVGNNNYNIKDTLKFTPALSELINDGSKKSTIRLEPKKLSVGDYVKLQTRFSKDSVRSFAVAKIISIAKKSLSDFDLNTENHESYKNYDVMLKDFQLYYGDDVSLDTVFTVYDFEKVADIITVFTTRPDTLFGATYMVLAPDNPIVSEIISADQKAAVEKYQHETITKSDLDRQIDTKEKTGVFTGAFAINPVNDERIPVWIADYVLMGYGTGAIMAVPAHDERDYDFATKFELPIVRVVDNNAKEDEHTNAEGVMINSGKYNGQASEKMREQIVADLVKQGIAKERVNYKLRDWIFSRQHYWGEPIPIIHCSKCGAVPVPESELPIVLPDVDHYEPTDNGESPLAEITDWINVDCPVCGGPAKRETDTMPNWAGSSWYYLRYFDARNNSAFADPKKLKYWGEVDLYLGGMEHTTLHLLYSRFWHQFFYNQDLVPTPEPYAGRRGQGIILASDGSKMSKSKGNVVNPTDIIEQGYGADALRMAITFLAPYDMTTPWNSEAVAGTYRFLQRVWSLVQEFAEEPKQNSSENEGEILKSAHKAIKKVSQDLENMNFNTAIAGLMEYTNELYKIKTSHGFSDKNAWQFALKTLVQLLAPFAPHITEELWKDLGYEGSVHVSPWPVHDEAYLVSHVLNIAVQVNGKLRGEIEVPHDATKEVIEAEAKTHENVASYLKGDIKKVIYIPGKILNFVV